jgi:hypothetical protein
MNTLSERSNNRAVAVELAKLRPNVEVHAEAACIIEQLLNTVHPSRRHQYSTPGDKLEIGKRGGSAREQ